jgi:4,5-DOPA dioxygenase extradiol
VLQPGRLAHTTSARHLDPLRDEGVLVVASGNIVHNLRLFRHQQGEPLDWALRFDEDVAEHIETRPPRGPARLRDARLDALLAIPSPEHYLPLLYALALQREDDPVEFLNERVRARCRCARC